MLRTKFAQGGRVARQTWFQNICALQQQIFQLTLKQNNCLALGRCIQSNTVKILTGSPGSQSIGAVYLLQDIS
eukprot:1143108-Pelagomonas_calceolata.AAC.1